MNMDMVFQGIGFVTVFVGIIVAMACAAGVVKFRAVPMSAAVTLPRFRRTADPERPKKGERLPNPTFADVSIGAVANPRGQKMISLTTIEVNTKEVRSFVWPQTMARQIADDIHDIVAKLEAMDND